MLLLPSFPQCRRTRGESSEESSTIRESKINERLYQQIVGKRKGRKKARSRKGTFLISQAHVSAQLVGYFLHSHTRDRLTAGHSNWRRGSASVRVHRA
jgi:hypothetical protein